VSFTIAMVEAVTSVGGIVPVSTFPSRLDLARSAGRSALCWMLVGVPVSAAVAALRVFVWVVFSLPEMILTAAMLGVVHGLWVKLASRPSGTPNHRWFGPVSGGLLGVLGFLPVVSRIDAIVIDRSSASVFLAAAIVGGAAAGFVSTRSAGRRRFSTGRIVGVGSLVVLPVAAYVYIVDWPPAADRLPVRRVSRESVVNITPGDAQGSPWSGCYDYLGSLSRGSGGSGKEGARLQITQTNGALKVEAAGDSALVGMVDARGRFRFGGERTVGENTLRTLWEGTFKDDGFEFTRRSSVWRGGDALNSTRLTGSARRCAS